MTRSALNHPVQQLPSSAPGRAIKVDVVPMTHRLAYQWHHTVQPLINAHYQISGGSGATGAVRADVGWDWVHWYFLAGLHNLTRLAGGHGPALAMCMVVDTGRTGEFPIGMLTTVPQFNCRVFDERRERAFGWFLSDAPWELYQRHLHAPAAKKVALALLDCGIQAALDLGEDGTFLLHADPAGGEKLLSFYEAKVGMQRLPADAKAITRLIRRNGLDEYFHFDDVAAAAFCQRFDPYR